MATEIPCSQLQMLMYCCVFYFIWKIECRLFNMSSYESFVLHYCQKNFIHLPQEIEPKCQKLILIKKLIKKNRLVRKINFMIL